MSQLQSDFPAFSQKTTESIRVMVSTPNYTMEGNLFLSRSMKENRRLTNLLNSDKRFIALTDVTMTDRKSGETDPAPYQFIQLNLDMVELIKPLSEIDEKDV